MESKTPISYSLANELWSNVLRNFALQPLELGQARPSEAFCSNRAALRQLCLTSHRFLNMARPYLYETIVLFTDADASSQQRRRGPRAGSLVLLVRALMQNHELRPLIKNLALPITLSADDTRSKTGCLAIVQTWFDYSASFTKLNPSDQEILDIAGLTKVVEKVTKNSEAALYSSRLPIAEVGSISQNILATLLCLTHNVERLLLQGLLTGPHEVFDQTLLNLKSHPQIGAALLPLLKTLQIQLDPRISSTHENFHDTQNLIDAKFSSPLLNQPQLSRVDIRYAWLEELDFSEKVLKSIARLTDINLMVAAEPFAVDSLMQEATAVKSLSIGLFAMPNFPDQQGDINTAILRRSSSLESLALDTSHCSSEHAANQLGPLGRITCLPQLTQLKRLAVEPHLLLDWLNTNTWPLFWNRLPRNLEELTLRFVPENGEDLLRIWARSGVGAALRASPEKWQSKMPHLRHIHLQPLPYSTRDAEAIRKDLKEAKIALTWQDPDLVLDFAALSLN